MQPLILFIKSYRPDFERAEKLLRSIEQYNVDRLPVWMSINDEDFAYFKERVPASVQVVKDSDVVACRIRDGWRYQQVVKTQVYRLGVCENYLCIDSDSEFIRPFYRTDFMYDERTPYTVMHESKAFCETMEILGRKSEELFHRRALAAVRKRFGTHGKEWDYGPSPYLWSTQVWRHFNEEYLASSGSTFESFLQEMERDSPPSETVCYGEYLLKTRLIDILPVEAFFKVYHFRDQFALEEPYFDLDLLRKNYLGIVMQSNWHGPRPQKKKRFWFWG